MEVSCLEGRLFPVIRIDRIEIIILESREVLLGGLQPNNHQVSNSKLDTKLSH